MMDSVDEEVVGNGNDGDDRPIADDLKNDENAKFWFKDGEGENKEPDAEAKPSTAPGPDDVSGDNKEENIEEGQETEKGSIDKDVNNRNESETDTNGDDGAGPEDESASDQRIPSLRYDIQTQLQCVGCTFFVPTPLRQCPGGHLLCLTCLSKHLKCPTCDAPLTKDTIYTNVALAKIAQDSVVRCRYPRCQKRVKHADLERHSRHCSLSNKFGIGSPHKAASKWDADEVGDDEDAATIEARDAKAREEIQKQLHCEFCGEVPPSPVHQCPSGHIACRFCLERIRRTDDPKCPFCASDMTVNVRNSSLETLASSMKLIVPCRYDGCSTQVDHSMLAEHLAVCEHRPIKCLHCLKTNRKSFKEDLTFASWDGLWSHYKESHLGKSTPTKLTDLLLSRGQIDRMLKGELGFLTWGHCVDPITNETVRLFPGVFYSKERRNFYVSVRAIGPLGTDHFVIAVAPATSSESSVRAEGCFPAVSYRTPLAQTADFPCLVISEPTMKLLTDAESWMDASASVRISVTVPEGCHI